jgi:hypothetical protein
MTERIERRRFLIAAAVLGPAALIGAAAARRPAGIDGSASAAVPEPDAPRYDISVETRYTTDGVPYLAAVAREI